VSEPTSPAQGSPLERMVRELAETWERRAIEWDALKQRCPEITSMSAIYREMAEDLRAVCGKLPNVSSSAATPRAGDAMSTLDLHCGDLFAVAPGSANPGREPRSCGTIRAVGSGRSSTYYAPKHEKASEAPHAEAAPNGPQLNERHQKENSRDEPIEGMVNAPSAEKAGGAGVANTSAPERLRETVKRMDCPSVMREHLWSVEREGMIECLWCFERRRGG
jgi:hypothetical protein